MRHQEVIFALNGQTLYLDPPELSQASAPGATVYAVDRADTDAAETATTGSASVDTVNTTLAADAAPGDNTLTLASGTGLGRRRFLVTSAAGLSEYVDVIGVNGAAVTLQRPLINDYNSGATFKGTRISISLSNTWVADSTKLTDVRCTSYRVRWTYTVDSAPQLAVTYFDLVRYSARALVTAQDIDNRYAGWIDRLPPDHIANQGASLIDSALEAIKLDAIGDSQALRRMRDSQIIRELVICKVNLLAIENQVYAGKASLEALTAASNAYTLRYQQLMREPKALSDETGSGAATEPAERLPLWRR
jgi:hypothetical protein